MAKRLLTRLEWRELNAIAEHDVRLATETRAYLEHGAELARVRYFYSAFGTRAIVVVDLADGWADFRLGSDPTYVPERVTSG